ncbi:acetylornithine deacetylase [Zhongshania sp. BJYM1]|uniref:acetylornithine deacetylase n=1 Tax=Zhongshania aquatica TaxID=2965069 RepID=UPI0022B2CBAA|nr:acetylornithine deacetylase [Marortus sp. BJYM1]
MANQNNIPSVLSMITELVKIPSVSSTLPSCDMGNIRVIEQLAMWLEPLGFQVKIQPIVGHKDKANLIATLGTGSGGLVLAGHTDTVPFNESLWQSDPFVLTERDSKLYGLGSTDMKGFFAIAIEALQPFLGKPLKAPLIILATADEESSMDGARSLVQADVSGARYAVVGEPTGLKPMRAHKGIVMKGITIKGRSGHSSNPLLGNNAMDAMHEVMSGLIQLRQELALKYQHPGFSVPTPTMNFGCIHGGDNPNRICGQCELHFDIRTTPGMDNDELDTLIQKILTPVAERRAINIGLRALMPGLAAYEEPADSELVTLVEQLTGQPAGTVGFATEAPFFQQLGMQTIVMGPGSIDQAHQPDEFMALDQIQPSIDVLRSMIKRFCA